MTARTGWAMDLCQDECRGLSKWFASRIDARQVVRMVCAEIKEKRMKNPKLTKTLVQIKYTSDDKYRYELTCKGGQGVTSLSGAPVPPEVALLSGLEELQRLCNLFGFAKQADERIAAVNGRMAEWRSKQAQAALASEPEGATK